MKTDEELYAIIQRYRPLAISEARNLNCEADDLLHDTFLEVKNFTRNRSLWPDPSGLIVKMLRNIAGKKRRRLAIEEKHNQTYHEEKFMSIEEKLALPLDVAWERLNFSPEMCEAWGALSFDQHFALTMVEVFEFTIGEIAEYRDVPYSTAASWLRRGRLKLAKALDKIRGEEVN
jgi:RNA polymerase sigma factor (sigma-70 family)